MASRDGEVKLEIGGKSLVGWQEVRVSRGLERMPSDFDVALTEAYPGGQPVPVDPGMPCVLKIGDDVVVTGFIDRYEIAVTKGAGRHVRVTGRGLCQDLVDCSAYLVGDNNQMSNLTAAGVVRKLCALHGITLDTPNGDGNVVPQFNVILTETSWDIIDRVARHSDFLAYEGPDGHLVLAKVGTEKMASGFREGGNGEAAQIVWSHDKRYSLYEVVFQPVETLGDTARAVGNAAFNTRARATDDTIGADAPGTGRRFRPLVMMAEAATNEAGDISQARADWEKARRYGRSQAVTVSADSWRDSARRLWTPNRLAPVHLPRCYLPDKEWIIADVTYRRGKDGTHADVTLMPKEAFTREPIILQPYDAQVAAALRAAPPEGAPAAPQPRTTGEPGE